MSDLVGICCICLKSYSILEGIYDTDENKVRHYEKLKLCVPNELWYKDYKICKNCLDNLDLSYHFIGLCLKSERNRKEIYGKNKGPYICSECNKSYKWEIVLKKHMKLHKDIKTNTYKAEEHIQDSDNQQSTESKISICESKLTKVESDLPPLEYKCELPKEVNIDQNDINTEELLLSEQQLQLKNDDSENEQFDVASYQTSTSSSEEDYKVKKPVKRHKVLTKKSSGATKKGPYKCDYCDEVFKYVRQLKTHIWTSHNFVRPFSCDQCSSTYKTSGALVIHKRIHTGERPYICTECGKGFRAGADLIRHSKTHSAKRGYQCPYCDKSFKTSGNLHMHKNCVHKSTEDYKFQCNQCGHKFPFKGHLDNHLKRHAGIKNFACHICRSKFILNAELDLHVRRVHRNEQRTNCDECKKEFKTLCGLRKHLKLAHNLGDYKHKIPERKFLCPYCPKMFPYNNKLQRHILTHTGEKPFQCEICSKGFRDKFDLKSHLTNNHQLSLDGLESSSI